jgi:outer membrane immunogenic protein
MKMKQYLLSSALCVYPFAASAAPVQPPFVASAFDSWTNSWTGAYGGLHMGVGWVNDPDAIVNMQRFTGSPLVPHPLQSAGLNSRTGPFGGAQIGYNWQFQPRWVVGLETDFSFSRNTKFFMVLNEGPITDTVSSTRGLDWFGTVRGRLGYLIDPRVLLYVTGGLAYGLARNDFNQAIVGPGPIGNFAISTSPSGARIGWTGGGGIQYALDARWSVKAEYIYLAFNDGVSSSNTIRFNPGKGGNTGVFNVQAANNSAHTIQIGLNYNFWGP